MYNSVAQKKCPDVSSNSRHRIGSGAEMSSASIVDAYKAELRDYDTGEGTIRFQPNEPLPATLVRKLVKARIAENAKLHEK